MKKLVFATMGLLAALAPLSMAQKQPQVKSQKELDAVQAVFNSQEPNARIAAVENLLTKFADTQFKSIALYIATVSAEQLGDFEKIMLYGERAVDADPQSYASMLIMAGALASKTREHDLDKEEKLSKAEKLASKAGEVLKTAPKLNPQMSDADWETAKKDFAAQQHVALGLVANARKKYDVGITEFKAAVESNGDPAAMVRLGQTYNLAGKPDDAVAILEKVMAIADAPAQIKQVAQAERARAIQAKSAKK